MLILIILNLSFITLIASNSVSTSDYGSFNVQKNDSRQYKFLYINIKNKDYIPTFANLQNGTQVAINLDLNATLTVKVTQVNSTFVETTCYYTKTTTINMQNIIPGINFVDKAYLNETAVQTVFQNLSGVSYDQNYIYHQENSNYRNILNNQYTYSVNWHTGWLESENYTFTNIQNNNYGHISLAMVPVPAKVIISSLSILIIRILLIVFITIALIFLYTRRKYKNYKPNVNNDNKSINFINSLPKTKETLKNKEI